MIYDIQYTWEPEKQAQGQRFRLTGFQLWKHCAWFGAVNPHPRSCALIFKVARTKPDQKEFSAALSQTQLEQNLFIGFYQKVRTHPKRQKDTPPPVPHLPTSNGKKEPPTVAASNRISPKGLFKRTPTSMFQLFGVYRT